MNNEGITILIDSVMKSYTQWFIKNGEKALRNFLFRNNNNDGKILVVKFHAELGIQFCL